MGLNERILVLVKILKSAKTENEKLAITAELADLLSEKVEDLDVVLRATQKLLHDIVNFHLPDSQLKANLLKFDYRDHLK